MNQPDNSVNEVLERLAILEPTAVDAPRPPKQALAMIDRKSLPRPALPLSRWWSRNLKGVGRRSFLAGAFSLLLFSLAFTFPAVRAAASDFLGLFRVQKFAAISISPEQLALLESVAQTGLVPGEFEILEEPGGMREVESLSAAASVTGLTVGTLRSLGVPEALYTTGEASGRLTIDLEGSRAILEATGVDPSLLPDSLDGKQINVSLFAGVEQRWPDGTWLLQTESPRVEYPDELDPIVLGEALLRILGMGQEEASRLAQSIDWTSTLLLPIPQDFASFNEVTVDGVSSLALSSLDGAHGVIMWQKEGVVYLLNGPGSSEELVSLANSLR